MKSGRGHANGFFPHSVGFLLVLAAAAACADSGPADGRAVVVSDSAGVEIVRSHAPAWGPGEAWEVSEAPVPRIGRRDGPAELAFGHVSSAGWLGDGRIFVGDAQARAVRVFSPEGELAGSLGREGAGPGEFEAFETVSRYRGDSLFVDDYFQSRVSVFGPDFRFARSFANPFPLEDNYRIAATLDDGRFLLYTPGPGRTGLGTGIVPDTSMIVMLSPDGSAADTLGAFVVTFRYLGPDERARPLRLQPFSRIAAAGDHILVTGGTSAGYREIAADGRDRRIVRRDHEPIPVTDEIIDAHREAYAEWIGVDEVHDPDRLLRSLEASEYFPVLPATSADVKVDSRGNRWIGRFRPEPGAPTTTWDVFDLDGVWLGSVGTPPGLDVHAVGEDHVLGVAADELGVQYVQVHELRR